MGGISAEKSLHFLRRNDQCDPEHLKLSLDPTFSATSVPTSSPSSIPTFAPTAKSTSAPTRDPTSSPTFCMYPPRVQLNSVSVDQLASYGCSVCYLQTYGTVTTTDNIRKCAGPYLFVGGRETASSTFKLGAFDLSSVILTQTLLDTPHLSNGVYWYFTPSNSFGFSRYPLILQYEADRRSIDGDARLSWHLDLTVGGFRLGSILPLNDATDYLKAIYNCPA